MEKSSQLEVRCSLDLQRLYDDIRAVETAVRAFRRTLEKTGRVCSHRGEVGERCGRCGTPLSESDRQLNEFYQRQREGGPR